MTENILAVPPHCLTYHRNQRAETSCGSDVTLTFTKRVANSLPALHETQEQKQVLNKCGFLIAFIIFSLLFSIRAATPLSEKPKWFIFASFVSLELDCFNGYISASLPSFQSIYPCSLKSYWFYLSYFFKYFPSCHSFHQNKYFSQQENAFGNLLANFFCISPPQGAHQAHHFQGLIALQGLN